MSRIRVVEDLLFDTFKVLNGLPNYIGIEEKDAIEFDHMIMESKLRRLISIGEDLQIKRISASINRSSEHYTDLSNILKDFRFELYASRVEVYRDLDDLDININGFEWRSLSDFTISEDEFKHYWERCMSSSENASSTLSMDEHLDSVKSELGDNWRSSCKLVYVQDKPIGVSIPHIEPGTLDEGRLFYFGLVPEEQGRGQSTLIHLQSLSFLKQMGATYYIGSTHETNVRMQKVFLNNGCSIKAHTESYYKYFKNRRV
ncbi:GNAT family N-acetyltransferase [Alkalihalobacillus sp. AL-G]|uniref:GNAT family N-acetyltransferase n=1 Tax=Alkalihalobacillus sp. AL-G TaxID=2926399 RepID=UPI00272A79C5|nr:GNAT family N-acetyltransferase [Alkalihalobacillus sp. AL-G]WLD93862.1 GNAT family N-acetyltransferase [Alkalihalobacillus sp. AL-G]